MAGTFNPMTKASDWNWHNIIASCEKIHNGKMNRLFKETFFAAITDTEPPEGHEKHKEEIKRIVTKYRADPTKWWHPEIVEYFYPDYLQAKSGAYFTPRPYCELLTNLTSQYIKKDGLDEGLKVYDPCCGVGALLITFKERHPNAEIYGQERDHESVLLARQLLLNKRPGDFNQATSQRGEKIGQIKSGDTLEKNKLHKKFHIVLANPPFNQKLKEPKHGTKEGNAAGVRQVTARMKKDAVAAIILPNGVLTTENFKEERHRLVRYNYLEAVFYNFSHKQADTGHKFSNALVSTCVLLLTKRPRTEQNIRFMDCQGLTMTEITEKGREKSEIVTRDFMRKNKYNFLQFILSKYHEENGTAISKMFAGGLVGRAKNGIKDGEYYLKICTKKWDAQKDVLEIRTDGNVEKGTEWLFLGSKEKTRAEKERKIHQLYNYLTQNFDKYRQFYHGAQINYIMRTEFLNGRIDLANTTDTHPHILAKEQGQPASDKNDGENTQEISDEENYTQREEMPQILKETNHDSD